MHVLLLVSALVKYNNLGNKKIIKYKNLNFTILTVLFLL